MLLFLTIVLTLTQKAIGLPTIIFSTAYLSINDTLPARYRNQPLDYRSSDVTLPQTNTIAHFDAGVAVNPLNASQVSVTTTIMDWDGNSYTAFRGPAFFYSNDAGQTWAGVPDAFDYSNAGDQEIAVNLSGRKFINYTNSENGQNCAFTNNNGGLWTTKKVADPPTGVAGLLYHNTLCVDNSQTSNFKNNLYSAWKQRGGLINCDHIVTARSTTNGLTWSVQTGVSNGVGDNAVNKFPDVKTGPNGEVYICWVMEEYFTADENAIGFARSTNGGVTWSAGKRLFDNIRGVNSTQCSKNILIRTMPVMTVDNSNGPFRGTIYVAWLNVGYPGENAGENVDIYLMKSSDHGDTWSAPIRVNSDPVPGGSNQFFPEICCDPVTGVVSTIFYDDRNCSPDQAEVWVASSCDGGESWEETVVSDHAFDVIPTPGLSYSTYVNKIGIAAHNNLVYPVWLDNSNHKPVVKISPFQLPAFTSPYITSVSTDQQTGQLSIAWNLTGSQNFSHFNIYRNGELIATTGNYNYTEFLPSPGEYKFSVSAQYAEGESMSSSRTMQWGDARLNLTSTVITLVAPTGSAFSRKFLLSNSGLLPLNYVVKPRILSDNTNPDYCTPGCSGSIFIRNVSIGNINHYSYWDGYGDFTDYATGVVPGGSDTLIWQVRNWVPEVGEEIYTRLWIDWNQNGVFETSEVSSGELFDERLRKFRAVIHPSEMLFPGNFRMRIFAGNDDLGPCDTQNWDEHEDYHLFNLTWINSEGFSGNLAADSSGWLDLNFDTEGLSPGNYIVDLNFEDKQTNTLVNTLKIKLNIDNEVFASPENLVAVPGTNNVLLSWQPPSNGNLPMGYSVYRYGAGLDIFLTDSCEYTDPDPGPGMYSYEVVAQYQKGESMPSNRVKAGILVARNFQLDLIEGWSGISMNLILAEPAVQNLFLGVPELKILYNYQGVYWPEQGVNTLENWNVSSGYVCKVANSTQLNASGFEIQNSEINLVEGWNIIPVLSDEPVSAETLFGQGYPGIVLVKEVAGLGVIWPEMGVFTLPYLQSGKAYFVKTSQPVVISF